MTDTKSEEPRLNGLTIKEWRQSSIDAEQERDDLDEENKRLHIHLSQGAFRHITSSDARLILTLISRSALSPVENEHARKAQEELLAKLTRIADRHYLYSLDD